MSGLHDRVVFPHTESETTIFPSVSQWFFLLKKNMVFCCTALTLHPTVTFRSLEKHHASYISHWIDFSRLLFGHCLKIKACTRHAESREKVQKSITRHLPDQVVIHTEIKANLIKRMSYLSLQIQRGMSHQLQWLYTN